MAGFAGASAILTTSNLPDDTSLLFGSGNDDALVYDTTDANANFLKLSMAAGGAAHVPVFAVGVGIRSVDLGLFDGRTEPLSAVVDLDRDSYVGLGFSADDVAVISWRAAAGTVRNHTIPDVASDTLTLNDAAQTLAAKTLTTPTIVATGWANATHAHAAANSGATLNAAAVAAGRLDLARLPAGTLNQVITGQGAGSDPIYAAAASAAVFTRFTSSGTWTKGSTGTAAYVICIGSGAGGGGGRGGAASSARHGGGGGGGGDRQSQMFPLTNLGATETVTIGAGGAGGAGGSSADGTAGTAGGATSFGSWIVTSTTVAGGGAGGTTSAGAGGGGGGMTAVASPATGYLGGGAASAVAAESGGAAGGAGDAGGGGPGGNSIHGCGGGGGGGGVTGGNAESGGAAGGRVGVKSGTDGIAGGAGGATNGGAGGAGTDQPGKTGPGGGGGGGQDSGTGGAGGAGALPGGGGGGGAGGTSTGGAGGAGGRGEVRVWEF